MDCIYWSVRLAKTRNELAKSFTPKSKNEQNIKVVSKCLRPSSKTMETGKVSQGKQSRPLICHTIYIAVCHAPDVTLRHARSHHVTHHCQLGLTLHLFALGSIMILMPIDPLDLCTEYLTKKNKTLVQLCEQSSEAMTLQKWCFLKLWLFVEECASAHHCCA